MVRYIVHIGRHKTGTTSVQQALAENSRHLQASGYLYPTLHSRNSAHHPLAKLVKAGDRETVATIKKTLDREAVENSCHTVILSSEVFQQVRRPKILSEFGKDIEIICYIRNPGEYLISTYQQIVHANYFRSTPEEYYEAYDFNLVPFLRSWVRAWKDSFKIRIFDREMLLEKDIVSDFFSVVGLDNPPSKVSVQANPSLAGNLFFFKLFLNRMMQGGKTPDPIVAQFESLSNQNPKWRGRLDLGDVLRRKIEDFSSVQEEEVRKAFGITFPRRQPGFLSGIDTSTLREDFDHMCNALHAFKSDLRTEDFVRAADDYLTDRNAR